MNILTAREFEEQKITFLHKHDDWQVETSPMDEYGVYRKTYVCEDGAQWFEVMAPVVKTAEVEVCKVKTKVEIKMLSIEAWNTDDGRSIYYYEKF